MSEANNKCEQIFMSEKEKPLLKKKKYYSKMYVYILTNLTENNLLFEAPWARLTWKEKKFSDFIYECKQMMNYMSTCVQCTNVHIPTYLHDIFRRRRNFYTLYFMSVLTPAS